MPTSLTVLFEDEHCLAVVKAAGQFVQGTWAPPGEQTLEQEVRCYLDHGAPASVYLGIVHRLDRPVSGVLLWAKTEKAARRLSRQFEQRRVEKEYWAIVELTGPSAPGEAGSPWTDWLTGAGVAGVVRSVPEGTERSRIAITRHAFAADEEAMLPERCRWLRLWPETGRTHQLRVQAAIRGMPILGDGTYGAERAFTRGIALHARRLVVGHPMLGTPLELVSPLPEAWSEAGCIIRPRESPRSSA